MVHVMGGQRVHSIGPQKLDRASKLQRLRPSPLDGSFAGFSLSRLLDNNPNGFMEVDRFGGAYIA